MTKQRRTAIAAAVLLALGSPVGAAELPKEAEALIQAFTAFEGELMRKAQAELAAQRVSLLADLAALEQTLAQNGDPAAVAVREEIQRIKLAPKLKGKQILTDPGNLAGYEGSAPGEILFFRTTGRTSGGSVWGSRLYTLDSELGMAAVHAGALKAGETGVVMVTLAPGQTKYDSSARHGVRTNPWGSHRLSYRVESIAE